MAHTAVEAWGAFFSKAGIPATESARYAQAFSDNRIPEPSDITKELLKDMGITVLGDIIQIMKAARGKEEQGESGPPKKSPISAKAPPVTAPQLKPDMTHAEFRKFTIDWGVFRKLSNLSREQIPLYIYNACDSSVQNSIINTDGDFFNFNEGDILKLLEKIVTKQSNPSVHRLAFANTSQSDNEPIKDYVVRLKSTAKDCDFSCPNCKFDLQPVNVRDQFIRGIRNSTLQTDILAKADSLKTLEEIQKNAQAFETALHDQSKLSDPADVMAASGSNFRRYPPRKSTYQDQSQHSRRSCSGCGSTDHGQGMRTSVCPAWGKNCLNCDTPNHFARVCRQKKREGSYQKQPATKADSASALIAQVEFHRDTQTYTSVAALNNVTEIPAEVTPLSQTNQKVGTAKTMMVFPDSGASICLAGPQHIQAMGIDARSLIPCSKQVRAVGGSVLTCQGWLPTRFSIGSNTTQQPLYICDKVDRIYFGRSGCIDAKILPECFPFPMQIEQNQAAAIEHGPAATAAPSSVEAADAPERPTKMPFPATEDNVAKLKQHLIQSFSKTAFSKSGPFKAMNTKPVHIHLKEDATPFATHVPIPVPIHWKEEIKANIDRDVANGVIEPVPIGEPVTWCSPMVVTTRKGSTKPRRTVDLQKLNAQCLRETHHCQSPFKLACQIPANTKKTVFDATDGYHSIELDDESKPLTTFITVWGRYRYRRLPQGYSAAGDAYTRRYDEIIKDVDRKVKCVDDTLLYDETIEDAYYRAWDYLHLCAENGITLNESKFQFCQDEVHFAGFRITPMGIQPAPSIITAIKDFPAPTDIHKARAWFGLVNQIAWAYSNTAAMLPFRELVKPSAEFEWNDNLQKLFAESKEVLIKQSVDGIRTFDTTRNTCLQTDWSKEGIGYLLLQQYCQCEPAKAPVCCKDGWKLVFAGSRFTQPAETRYSPTEGEALAVAWALEHARFFILGCENLLISTDHQALTGILRDRDLGTIKNPRILGLKERTLPYRFKIQFNPGKWHRAPDALSRNPVAQGIHATECDQSASARYEELFSACALEAATHINSHPGENPMITIDDIRQATKNDPAYESLTTAIMNGFPPRADSSCSHLRQYWNVRDKLSIHNDLAMMDGRLIIPSSLRPQILRSLHAAHQGVSKMMARARQAVYWPGLEMAVKNTRYNCQKCSELAPSQSSEPPKISPTPIYPFQHICMDFFQSGHHNYLAIVDRFSGWIAVYHFPNQTTSRKLMEVCRDVFAAYGAPEEISTDGGTQFTSSEFQAFMGDWGITHRLSSAEYPQSNGRAEAGVKSAKKIIRDNTNNDGSLNNDKAVRAILQHRNTPIPVLGLSPAQLLLHRQLRDALPTNPKHYKLHKEWIISASQREEACGETDQDTEDQASRCARPLKPLSIQTPVRVQSKGLWTKSGRIVEVLPHRQYRVRIDGSGRVTLRNRKFLRPAAANRATDLSILPSADYSTMPTLTPRPQTSSTPPAHGTIPEHDPEDQAESLPAATAEAPPAKLPRALRGLGDHNEPGLRESVCEQRRRPAQD